ncbi:hypothetical protein QSK_0803, partial [Clostridioides difficile P29]
MITLQSSSYYSLYSPNLYRDNFIDIIRFTTNQILSFLPLDYPPQKRKSPVKSLATIGGALHSLLGFLFAVSSTKRKKVIRPHHQNGYFSILPVIIPYLLLNWGLSFLRLDKVSYIYVPLCFPRTYPCCINHHSGLTVFETS